MAFEGLTEKIMNTFKKLRGKGRLKESDVKEAMREIRMALLDADVEYSVAREFIAHVKEQAMGVAVLKTVKPGEQIVKITIKSNVEWAEGYPAGSDLSPLFTAKYGSLSDYIASGYDENSYIIRSTILSETTAADMAPLLESDWNIFGGTDLTLTTTTLPENYYDHTITIALTLDTGEVIEYTERLSDIMLW